MSQYGSGPLVDVLRFAERTDAVAAARALAARYRRPFEIREIADTRVWDSYHAKYVPRTYGWAMWEVLGPDGFRFSEPNGYVDPDEPEENEQKSNGPPASIKAEDEWNCAESWMLFGPNADQYD